MRIGDSPGRSGTSARSIRYYEQQGLMVARRQANGYRDYDEAHLRLVGEIRSLLTIGFDLEEIRPFVDCLHAGIQARQACPGGIASTGASWPSWTHGSGSCSAPRVDRPGAARARNPAPPQPREATG